VPSRCPLRPASRLRLLEILSLKVFMIEIG
jgi:hypothetical protein